MGITGGGGTDAARVAWRDLASLDIEAYEGLGPEAVAERLREIAGSASVAQLEAILDGPADAGRAAQGDKPGLVERYVALRLDAVLRLRSLRGNLDLEGLS